ncbi:MAG: 50S ribosomal protein L29 [Prevotellaceae bacterium]|jgi:large subunit ribosomal protein L29|nr:50S ribosomal protein L29 [Prevotellaceae bacterium]
MKTEEIREMSINDLIERIETERVNLLTMKMNHAISPIENTSKLRESRKNIARMLTVLQQKQTNEKK